MLRFKNTEQNHRRKRKKGVRLVFENEKSLI